MWKDSSRPCERHTKVQDMQRWPGRVGPHDSRPRRGSPAIEKLDQLGLGEPHVRWVARVSYTKAKVSFPGSRKPAVRVERRTAWRTRSAFVSTGSMFLPAIKCLLRHPRPGESTPPPESQPWPASGWPRSARPNSASASRQIPLPRPFDLAGNSLWNWIKNPRTAHSITHRKNRFTRCGSWLRPRQLGFSRADWRRRNRNRQYQ
jgi:hypothetical protein